MDVHKYKVGIEFTEPILGSQPQKDVVTEFINPAPEDDELEALPEKLEKATTAFHKVDGQPVLWDYQVKGFLKASASVINGLKTEQTKALRSKVEAHVFVYPRVIPLILPEGAQIEYLERSIRVNTPQGPRVALARSEMVPAGTKIEIEIHVLVGSPITRSLLEKILSYGEMCGLGQWRSGGFGAFKYELHQVDS